MIKGGFSLWAYLSRSPLLWLTITVGVYCLADTLSLMTGRNPLANPVLCSVLVIGLILYASQTPYADYVEGAKFVHFLLGPATVALALPLYHNRIAVMEATVPIAAALLVGSVTAIFSALTLGVMFDCRRWRSCLWHRNRRRQASPWAYRNPSAATYR